MVAQPTETMLVPQATIPETAPNEPRLIAPSDPRIRYTGRIDFSDPARPAFDWPAVAIEAAFAGPSLTVLLNDGQNSYNVRIDDRESVLTTHPGQERYVVAQGLDQGPHTVRLVKRTETFYGTPQFLGFELEPGYDLTSPPQTRARRIEFIGDSITAGYGVEGLSPFCTFSRDTENAELTYAAMTAGDLEADFAAMAISGIGIVRNYSAAANSSSGTMLSYYDLTTTGMEGKAWDFERWTPDAVVINLGTNDFSTAPHPTSEVFVGAYLDLIIKVRNRYPEAHIFAIAGPIMVNPAPALIQSAVDQMRDNLGDERVYFVNIENNLELSAVDYGCDWHPNASGHRKIANQLIPYMRQKLQW